MYRYRYRYRCRCRLQCRCRSFEFKPCVVGYLPEPFATLVWQLRQNFPDLGNLWNLHAGMCTGTFRNPLEPRCGSSTGTLRNLPEPFQTLTWHLHRHFPAPSGTRPGICTGTSRNFPEPSWNLRNLEVAAAPELPGAFPEPSGTSGTLPGKVHRNTPMLIIG